MARYKYYGDLYLRETENRDLYYEEVERIRAIIDEYEQQEGVKMVHFDLPQMPSRITKKYLNTLETIDEEYIESMIEWDDVYDELPNVDEAEIIIDEFKDIYNSIGNRRFSRFMNQWLDHIESNPDIGKRRVAGMLQNMMDNGFTIERKVRYNLDDCLSFLSEILDEMPGVTTSEKVWLMDSFEAQEIWNETG